MEELYQEFLPRLPKGGYILDAGCGSGQDAFFFDQKGYRVSAFDGSDAIASLAREKTGLSVQHRYFSDIHEPVLTTVYGPVQVSCTCFLPRCQKLLAGCGMP